MGDGGPRNIFRQTMARQLPDATYSEHMSATTYYDHKSAHVATTLDQAQENGFEKDESIDFSREDYMNDFDIINEEKKITINLPLIVSGVQAHQL